MIDSRLQQIEALVDDARTLAADIYEECPSTANRLELKRLRKLLNDAIRSVQTL